MSKFTSETVTPPSAAHSPLIEGHSSHHPSRADHVCLATRNNRKFVPGRAGRSNTSFPPDSSAAANLFGSDRRPLGQERMERGGRGELKRPLDTETREQRTHGSRSRGKKEGSEHGKSGGGASSNNGKNRLDFPLPLPGITLGGWMDAGWMDGRVRCQAEVA